MGTTLVNIGVDVGQVSDPTTICVTECSQIDTGKKRYESSKQNEMETTYTIRHIVRLPLHTSYPDVSAHILKILCNGIFTDKKLTLYMDITGIGRAVYDDIIGRIEWYEHSQRKNAASRIGIHPVTFVSGREYNQDTGSLGKLHMVSRLQSLLQNGRIHAPNTPEVTALQDELKVYEIRVSEAGRDSYGAISGKHDDLVTALGLAVLVDPWATSREADRHIADMRERVALQQKRAGYQPQQQNWLDSTVPRFFTDRGNIWN